MAVIFLLILGFISGALSGLVGIGGGVIIVPSLVLLFGLTQQHAQGTTLALLVAPIGIFAAMTYYKQGYVDLKIAILIGLGFILGSIIGSKLAIRLPTVVLTKIFGISLLLIGLKMLFTR